MKNKRGVEWQRQPARRTEIEGGYVVTYWGDGVVEQAESDVIGDGRSLLEEPVNSDQDVVQLPNVPLMAQIVSSFHLFRE